MKYYVLDSDILGTELVTAYTDIAVPMPDTEAQILNIEYAVKVSGTPVIVSGVGIRIEEAEPVPTCSFTTHDLTKKNLFKANAPIEITIGTDVFNFVIDSVRISRQQPGQVDVEVSGVDVTAYYDFPRVLPYTANWETATEASAIVSSLLGGASISWNIVNWTIPAFRVAIDRGNPLTLAQDIVEAAGGVIESDMAGGFNVRYRHPVATNKYGTITPDFEHYTAKDIIELPEQFNVADYYDNLRVVDVETGDFQDVIQYEQDELDRLTGVLRVWPYPYDQTVTVTHTSDADVVLTRTGVVTTAVQDEIIEIFDGEGQAKYPIFAIDSIEWVQENLLGLVFEQYTSRVTSTHTTKKYSLVRLSYRTRAIHYQAKVTTSPAVQFLVNRS